MKQLLPLRVLKFKLYIQCFLVNLILGHLFRKSWYGKYDKNHTCAVCGKLLKNRRFEVMIDRPLYDYTSEFDNFLCLNHAIEVLLDYKGRERKGEIIE